MFQFLFFLVLGLAAGRKRLDFSKNQYDEVYNATWYSEFDTLLKVVWYDNFSQSYSFGQWDYSLSQQKSRMDFFNSDDLTKTTYIWDWAAQTRYRVDKPLSGDDSCVYCSLPSSSSQIFLNVSSLPFQKHEYKSSVYRNSTIKYWERDDYLIPIQLNFLPQTSSDFTFEFHFKNFIAEPQSPVLFVIPPGVICQNNGTCPDLFSPSSQFFL